MEPKSRIKTIVEEINRINYNVNAETIVNDLVQGGFSVDDIVVGFNSKHKKNWEKDIQNAEVLGNKIHIRLTRNGFIQSLPEYLFLKPMKGDKEEMEEIAKFNKDQLKYASFFFNPVENEIFHTGVSLEYFENTQIASLISGNNQSITEFWKIDYQLQELDYIKLCKIIPGLHNIVGNFSLTADCLSYLLDVSVSVKLDKRLLTMQFSDDTSEDPHDIGNSKCGSNLVLGHTMQESLPTMVFTIGPVSDEDVVSYLERGAKYNLIVCFVSYFIPIQYETDFVVNVTASGSGFALNNSYMGFNSTFNL